MERKLSPRKTYTGPNVRLTREDVEAILELFRSSHAVVSIEDDECTFISLDELEQYRGKTIGHLKFIGRSPDSVFEINNPINGRVTLTTSDIDGWFASFDKITDLLTKRSRFKNAPIFLL